MYQIPGQFNSSPTRDSDQLCLLQRRVQVIANYRKTVSVIDNQMTVSVANNDSQFASVTDTNKNKTEWSTAQARSHNVSGNFLYGYL